MITFEYLKCIDVWFIKETNKNQNQKQTDTQVFVFIISLSYLYIKFIGTYSKNIEILFI